MLVTFAVNHSAVAIAVVVVPVGRVPLLAPVVHHLLALLVRPHHLVMIVGETVDVDVMA
jgi:hypothetical protein